MASYHLTAKIGKKGKAAAHAAYIAREGKYSGRDRYEDLEATASGNMPEWAAHNAAHFWTAADEHERINGSVYREIEVALPRELTPAQRLELVQEFIEQEIGDKHAYQFAIHTPKAALEKDDQPHAHIMYSERIRDGIARDPEHYFKRYNAKNPEKGGAKKFSGGKSSKELKDELLGLRERWATLQNMHLEKHGHNDRVDHRSLKDQCIEREPEKHLGAIGVNRLNAHAISALLERRAAEGELERAQREVSIIDLSGDLEKAKAERIDESLKSYKPLFNTADKKAAEEGHNEKQRGLILEQVKEILIQRIESGVMPRINEKKSFDLEAAETQQTKQPEKRIEPVLRQEVKLPPPKPEVSSVELAEQTRSRFFEETREAWLKETTNRYTQEAEGLTQQYWKLKGEEPKEPLLFGKKDWEIRHGDWVNRVNGIAAEVKDKKQIAEVVKSGKFDDDPNKVWGWNQKAQERLENERPELAQALKEKHQAEQQKAKKEAMLDKTLSAFKVHAFKREMKAFGYGETGKQWNAIPEKLRTMIEGFNQLPKEARPMALEGMREVWTRKPETAEKIAQQLEQAEEQNRDRGMSR
ncbi:MAG: MobA/MobL family protein [Patescibacteria group bacterium]|jgi:hypothetical protein